jgi:predicted nuclease with TOPRIM domain
MDSLKPVLPRYISVSKKLNELNAEAARLRDEKKSLELDLAAVYGTTNEELPNKIELTSSQMIFQVKRPNEWKKGWTLSKKQLTEYLVEILGEQRGKDVLEGIIQRHEPKLVADDFGFELKSMATE